MKFQIFMDIKIINVLEHFAQFSKCAFSIKSRIEGIHTYLTRLVAKLIKTTRRILDSIYLLIFFATINYHGTSFKTTESSQFFPSQYSSDYNRNLVFIS